jgi:hypothetical protein
MDRSETLTELAPALVKAQAEMSGAKKDSTNPHFRSSYADLASVWAAVRGPLTSNGLAVIQSPRLEQAEGDVKGEVFISVETLLIHTSGEWISDTLAVPLGAVTAQGVGSAITYARRYALGAICGIAPEDDDGNQASIGVPAVTGRQKSKAQKPAGATISEAQQRTLIDTAKQHGWDEVTLGAHLLSVGIERRSQIKRSQFDDILASVESGPDVLELTPPVDDEEPVL